MHSKREPEKLEHPTLNFIDRLQAAKLTSRRTTRGSLSQDFTKVLMHEREVLEESIRKRQRFQRRMECLNEDERKRAESLQNKLVHQLEVTNKNREEQISKRMKKCRMHARVVRKKLEKYAKSIKLNTLQAGKSLKEFHKTMEEYRLSRRKSGLEREKELYWKHALKTQVDAFQNQRHQTNPKYNHDLENEERSVEKWADKKSSANRSTGKLPETEQGRLAEPVSVALPAPTYEQKFAEVKWRADKLHQEKEQQLLQKYADKMVTIKNRKNKKEHEDESGSSSEQDEAPNFLTEVHNEKKSPSQRQPIFVKSLLKPLRIRSTDLHRVKDHSQENVANKQRLREQMHHRHDCYLEDYTAKFNHVRALKELKEQLRQRKLHDLARF